MKRIILLFTLLSAATLMAKAQNTPEIKFVAESHNFGKIAQGKPVTVVYRFTNTGNGPLIISNAQADCGCTTPIVSPALNTAMQRGESGTIKVTYDAASMGTFTKNVTLSTNTKDKTKILVLKGEVIK